MHIASTAAQDLFRVDDNGLGDTSPFLIDQYGNVGIGRTSPSYKLHVEDNKTTTILYVQNTGTSVTPNAIEGHSAEVGAASYTAGYLGGYTTTASKWFGVRGTTKSGVAVLGEILDGGTGIAGLFLDGGVGIGVSSPQPGSHMLDVKSNKGAAGNSAIRATYPTGGGLTDTEFAALASRDGQWNAIYGKQGNAAAALYTDGEVNMMGGNIGIGTTAPNNKLDVAGTAEMTGFKMTTRV
jgi:hypothetical protein